MSSASEIPPVPAATPVPGWGAIVFAVAVASLAGVLFGYDTGVASGIQGYLQSYFHLSNAQLGFAIASLDIGCILGALLAGPITDRFGRKRFCCFAPFCLLFQACGPRCPVSSGNWSWPGS